MSELRLKSTGTIKLFENDNTSNVTIASPASLTTDRTITLPDGDVTLVAGTMATGGVALTGSTNNTLTTVTGADAISGETNLTFDGTDLTVATGNVVMGTSGKGIDFSATSGTGTSEVLDDYEYGTFTPTAVSASGSFTTVGPCYGWYTKIGKMVQAQMEISITTNGTASANIDVGNLPFTSAATGILNTVNHGRETQIDGSTFVTIMSRDVTTVVMLGPPFGNGAGYSLNGTYRVG